MNLNRSAACAQSDHDACIGTVRLPAPRNVCDCGCHAPSGDDRPTAPHRYVPTGAARWRTCALCGIGANANIHRVNA